MAYTVYNCTALTGGAERALDALAVASLAANDRAICVVSGVLYVFSFSTGTAAEQTTTHPYIIRPDDYGTSGNWTELVGLISPLFTTQGDILYASAAKVPARLAKGAANTKLFMNAGATAPAWAIGIKTASLTRAHDGATGDVEYTGVGFMPAVVLFWAHGADPNETSIGHGGVVGATSAGHLGTNDGVANSNWLLNSGVIGQYEAAGKSQAAVIKSLDADGFTLTWTRTGATKAGTITSYYIAFR